MMLYVSVDKNTPFEACLKNFCFEQKGDFASLTIGVFFGHFNTHTI